MYLKIVHNESALLESTFIESNASTGNIDPLMIAIRCKIDTAFSVFCFSRRDNSQRADSGVKLKGLISIRY